MSFIQTGDLATWSWARVCVVGRVIDLDDSAAAGHLYKPTAHYIPASRQREKESDGDWNIGGEIGECKRTSRHRFSG